MSEYIFPSIFLFGSFLAALLGCLAIIGSLQLTKNRTTGFLHIIPYCIVFTSVLIIAFSGRDLSLLSVQPSIARSGMVTWVQRFFTVAMLLVALERIGSAVLKPETRNFSAALLWIFIAFWLGSTLSPVLFARHSMFSHDSVYPLVLGMAALMANSSEVDAIVRATRNAIFSFTALSWLLVLIAPRLVLEANYSQGFFPGVPRLAGLAAHAVVLGMMVQIGMYCLWVKPYKRKSINTLAWVVLISALLLSQAKTAWLSVIICGIILAKVRAGDKVISNLFNSRKPLVGTSIIAVGAMLVFAVALFILVKDPGNSASTFLATKEGAQLASLTGRDQIWAAALNEWRREPIFGYGTELFSVEHRASLGLLSATHAHNQIVDTLARAGLVGILPFFLYVFTLGFYSFRYAKITGGLSAALFGALFLRGVSEIPFTMAGYGHEFLGHFLLIAVIAAAYRDSHSSAGLKKNPQLCRPVPNGMGTGLRRGP